MATRQSSETCHLQLENVTGLLPHFCCHAVKRSPLKFVLLHEKQNNVSSPNCLFIRYGGIETITKTKSQYQLEMLHFFWCNQIEISEKMLNSTARPWQKLQRFFSLCIWTMKAHLVNYCCLYVADDVTACKRGASEKVVTGNGHHQHYIIV